MGYTCRRMTRRCSTALMAAVLAGASLEAPFAHMHPKDPDHHHAHGFTHAHLAWLHHHDEGTAPEVSPREDDERAIYLDWAPTAAPRLAVAYSEAPASLTAEPALAAAGVAPEFRPRAHSPPPAPLSPARSPPL